MSQFDNVSVVKKANVYFDGKCVSHTVLFADGTRKSVGVIFPSKLTFNTDARCTAGMTTLNNVSLPSMLCGIVNQTGLPLTGFTFSFNSPQLLTLLVSTATPGLGTWTQNFNGTLATFMFATPLPTPNGDIAINFVNFGAGLPIGVAAVPEPASLTLVGAGLGALLIRRRARRAIG